MTSADLLPASWEPDLGPLWHGETGKALRAFLAAEEAAGKVIYPPAGHRLAALALTPLPEVRVVVLGQDPYHGAGQAQGLAFSVAQGCKIPPSLRNIYKELQSDLGLPPAPHGDLSAWASQGVLLLNNVLSVEQAKPASHAGKGWEAITDACIRAIAAGPAPCAFLLWGNHAQKQADRLGLDTGRHLLLRAPHPSPLSAYHGFFGSKPFSQTNAFLQSHGRGTIDWGLPTATGSQPLLI
jgi:uracil-DNA glycosylase